MASMGDKTGAYRVLVGRPKEWSPLESSRLRWEESIEMDLKESGMREHGLD